MTPTASIPFGHGLSQPRTSGFTVDRYRLDKLLHREDTIRTMGGSALMVEKGDRVRIEPSPEEAEVFEVRQTSKQITLLSQKSKLHLYRPSPSQTWKGAT
jgi:hypothetical protein